MHPPHFCSDGGGAACQPGRGLNSPFQMSPLWIVQFSWHFNTAYHCQGEGLDCRWWGSIAPSVPYGLTALLLIHWSFLSTGNEVTLSMASSEQDTANSGGAQGDSSSKKGKTGFYVFRQSRATLSSFGVSVRVTRIRSREGNFFCGNNKRKEKLWLWYLRDLKLLFP